MREIIQDSKTHVVGEREVVERWDRPDGKTYRNVPIVYLREVDESAFKARHPELTVHAQARYFWEVSID